ncbi:MAG TPA: glycosyltransferase family 2 protein [Opitutaceae bacterium]|nr:glycosyltransferase family 2 protein [Opitutaceae bacterium]
MTDAPSLSIVVPCYNEESILAQTMARLHASAQATGRSYEIVAVDDGSLDRTWEIIAAEARRDPRLHGIRFSRNFGHQMALTAGLKRSRGSEVLIIDADLQDPPELLAPMLAKRAEGFDIVYGQRRSRAGETWFKLATAKIFYRLIGFLAEVSIPPDTGDFRLMSRRAVDAFLLLPETSRFVRGMVAWIGYPQVAVPYDRAARTAGTTKYSLTKMLRFAADGVTGFSIKPLRLASLISAGLFGTASLITLWAVITWLYHGTVRGWTSLIVTVLFIGGVQTLILGIIGEYIGRLFLEVKHRPLYLVREDTLTNAKDCAVANDGPTLAERSKDTLD